MLGFYWKYIHLKPYSYSLFASLVMGNAKAMAQEIGIPSSTIVKEVQTRRRPLRYITYYLRYLRHEPLMMLLCHGRQIIELPGALHLYFELFYIIGTVNGPSHGRIKAWARRARAQGPHKKKAPTRFERNNKIINFKIKFKPESTFSQFTYVK